MGAYFQRKEWSVLLIATEIASKISHCPKDKSLWGTWQQPGLWSGGELEQSVHDIGRTGRERVIAGRDLLTRNLLFPATESLNQSGINPHGIYCSMWLKLGADVIWN